MIRGSLVNWGEGIIDEGLSNNEGWPDIVDDLVAEGFTDEEIVFHLTTLKASWADVGRALMAVGLPPADMLRAVLPSTEEEDYWPVFQVALLDGPEDADYGEVRGVLGFVCMSEEEALGSMSLDSVQREFVTQRLGVSR